MTDIIPKPQVESKARSVVMIIATIIGSITFLGSAWFALRGAGIYGSPFEGGTWFNCTLLLVLVFGPLAVLPSAIVERFCPSLGGAMLCVAAVLASIALILHNQLERGFNIYSAAIGTVLIALPTFILGTLILRSSSRRMAGTKILWWSSLVVVLGLLGFYFWQVGITELYYLLT